MPRFRNAEEALPAIALSSDPTSIVRGNLFDSLPISEPIQGIAIADE